MKLKPVFKIKGEFSLKGINFGTKGFSTDVVIICTMRDNSLVVYDSLEQFKKFNELYLDDKFVEKVEREYHKTEDSQFI